MIFGKRRLAAGRPALLRVLVLVIAAGAFVPAPAAAPVQLGFTVSVSERLVDRLSGRFGPEARNRIEAWKRFARERRESPPARETELLAQVNAFFNRLPFVSDRKHWGVDDYWATPAEAVASNGADCEDYSVAKYLMLKELGVPISRLRITYVTSTRVREPHMVLAYYASPGAEPLVLDNLDGTVRPASQRPDLTPVYSFNDDEVWLAQKGAAGSPLQIRKWRDLIERLEREARL